MTRVAAAEPSGRGSQCEAIREHRTTTRRGQRVTQPRPGEAA